MALLPWQETYLSFTLVLFLACATTFINAECGWSGAPVCDWFAVVALALLGCGLAVGLLTPFLSALERRRLRRLKERETYEVFLSHVQRTGGDQSKLLAMLLCAPQLLHTPCARVQTA